MSDDQKFGLTVLAVLGVMILAATQALGMGLNVPHLVEQLGQHATDLLRRLLS